MKKIIVLFSACMLFGIWGFSQEVNADKVPAAVKEAFTKKFPAATYVKYEMEKKDYEVKFKDNGVGMSANFNSKGEWLETETVMIESDLPKEVLTSAATNFVGFVMTEITKVEGPDKVLNYEMNLKKGKVGYEVKFSPKGEILKKTPVKS
ncbi:MAG: PepSY-like domain-containing protein [Bacteroidetes bacterium]|nr:PepSY-like domain-containing protein [Bacteroidota bacterium]